MSQPKKHKKRNPIARWLLTNRLQFGTKKTANGRWYHRAREKRRIRKELLVVAAVFFLWSSPADAFSICLQRLDMLNALAIDFDEHLEEVRPSKEGLMEILVSSDGDTYTVILTESSGISCIKAVGDLPKLNKLQGFKEFKKSS